MNDNSPNPYFCKSAWTCPEQNHCNSLLKMNERTPRTRGNFSWTTQWGAMTAYFRPSHQKSIAPLICRVVRAMRAVRWRWALGLDSRWATPLRSVSNPNLRFMPRINIQLHTDLTWNTYRTKLKLDKEVGGGGFPELCTITYLIAYPLCLNHKFQNPHRNATHMTPTSNSEASQAAAWIHRYIGYWTEGSRIGSIAFFEGWKAEHFPGQKW